MGSWQQGWDLAGRTGSWREGWGAGRKGWEANNKDDKLIIKMTSAQARVKSWQERRELAGRWGADRNDGKLAARMRSLQQD